MARVEGDKTIQEVPYLRTQSGIRAVMLLSASILFAGAGITILSKTEPIDPFPYDPNATPEIYTLPSDQWTIIKSPPPYEGIELRDIKHVVPEDVEKMYEKQEVDKKK